MDHKRMEETYRDCILHSFQNERYNENILQLVSRMERVGIASENYTVSSWRKKKERQTTETTDWWNSVGGRNRQQGIKFVNDIDHDEYQCICFLLNAFIDFNSVPKLLLY